MRISVSGTRGKTSIVRTLASVFRSNNIRVLAKTTGSEPKYILPDGVEETIKRRGRTTILEQKRLIRKAVQLNADCIITEIMSIHPECHLTETRKLIKPGFTIISNIRADHVHVAGKSVEEISQHYSYDIHPLSTVLLHENETNEILERGISGNGSELIQASKDTAKELPLEDGVLHRHIPENLDLVCRAALHFGVDSETVRKGIINARLDRGKLEIFTFRQGDKELYFVNSFAANDPESTMILVEKAIRIIPVENPTINGLLSLRADRGERSRQWLDYLSGVGRTSFALLFFAGCHAKILHRKIRYSEALQCKNPEHITNHIVTVTENNSIIFGMGNFIGLGEKLVDYWYEKGAVF